MDEDDKKDDVLLEGAVEEALEEETDDEEDIEPALGLDEFGAGIPGEEKQWE